MEYLSITKKAAKEKMQVGVSLYNKYKDYFDIGVSLQADCINRYSSLINQNFKSITPENELKWSNVHPQIDEYDFSNSDKIINFARENNKLVRGHTLIWHVQTPEWLFKNHDSSSVTRGTLLNRMEEHICTVVDRYKDDIYCWDVVNETVADEDKLLKNTYWKDYVGEDYIEKAFHFAHDANPKALLFLMNIIVKSKKSYKKYAILLSN